MKKLITGVVCSCLLAMGAVADQLSFNKNIPQTYVVKKGDTLWDISDMYLVHPWKWPEIWHANPQIKNPHLIYPGDTISLVYIDGKPHLMLNRGSQGRTVKLSPGVKVVPESEAISVIPLDIVNNFLTRNRIVTAEEIAGAPYVVAAEERRLLSGEGDNLYARGNFDAKSYAVYRIGSPYVRPGTKPAEVLGIRAQDIGSTLLENVEGDIGNLYVNRMVEEVRIGDKLLPHEERFMESVYYPSAPDKEVKGTILTVEGGVSQAGRLDILAVSVGKQDGVEEGNVLAIHKLGETITDRVAKETITLPSEKKGLAMVIRAFDKMSYVFVLDAQIPVSVGDVVQTP